MIGAFNAVAPVLPDRRPRVPRAPTPGCRQDVLPFCRTDGLEDPKTYGINTIGLKRARVLGREGRGAAEGLPAPRQSKLNTSQALERIDEELPGQPDVEELVAVHPDERAGLHQVSRRAPMSAAGSGPAGGGRGGPSRAAARPRGGADCPASRCVGSPRPPRGPGRGGGPGVRARWPCPSPEEVAARGRGRRRRDADRHARRARALLSRARPGRPRREADRGLGRRGGSLVVAGARPRPRPRGRPRRALQPGRRGGARPGRGARSSSRSIAWASSRRAASTSTSSST